MSADHTTEGLAGATARAKFEDRARLWVILLLIGCVSLGIWLSPGLPSSLRFPLWVYAITLIFWLTTRLDASWVAMAAILALATVGGNRKVLAGVLESDIVWIMVGTFVMSEAMISTGLAQRVTSQILSKAKNWRQLCWLLTIWLMGTAFIVPSTTGRAALALPLMRSMQDRVDARILRCLRLLIPTVVLLGTTTTLTGAAAHLLANDLLQEAGHVPFSFNRWLLLAGPFGLVATTLAAMTVMHLFLPRGHLEQDFAVQLPPSEAWNRRQILTLLIMLMVLTLWLTSGLHGISIAAATLGGAMLLTLPRYGVLKWQDALRQLPWELFIFAGAATQIGRILSESGASRWLITQTFESGLVDAKSTVVFGAVVVLIAVTAHLYMTSHLARVAALVPPLMLVAAERGFDVTATAFIAAIGIDYSLTFPVSSKAILLYEPEGGESGERARDLLRVSTWLMPLYVVLIGIFYFLWWSPLGIEF